MHSSSRILVFRFLMPDGTTIETVTTYGSAVAGLASLVRELWADVMPGDPPDDDEEAIWQFGEWRLRVRGRRPHRRTVVTLD